MCQRRPGPRCSNHARTRLDEARLAKQSAEFAVEAITADAPRPGEVPPEEYALYRDTTLALRIEATKAAEDYQRALREFEATPAGMQALQEAIERVGADTDEGRQMTASLEAAQALRSFQMGELRASKAYQERLTYLSAGERAALDQSESATAAAERTEAEAADGLRTATERMKAVTARTNELRAAAEAAQATHRQSEQAAIAARDEVAEKAYNLYREHGVSERMARFYATDTITDASRTPGARWDRGAQPGVFPRQPLALKVKTAGPDAHATIAARRASEIDADFVAARTEWDRAGAAVHHAAEVARDAMDALGADRSAERSEAARGLRNAQAFYAEATARVPQAREQHRDLMARIGSGISTQPVTAVRLANAGDEFRRNPDGTTNAYVYQPPSEGFEHGRYLRAIDVTTAHGMGPVNALVLENGVEAALHGHYAARGGQRFASENRSGVQEAFIVPAQDGSVPLREENLATSGFYAFLDTTG